MLPDCTDSIVFVWRLLSFSEKHPILVHNTFVRDVWVFGFSHYPKLYEDTIWKIKKNSMTQVVERRSAPPQPTHRRKWEDGSPDENGDDKVRKRQSPSNDDAAGRAGTPFRFLVQSFGLSRELWLGRRRRASPLLHHGQCNGTVGKDVI